MTGSKMAESGSEPRRGRRRRLMAGIAGAVILLAAVGGTVAAIGFARGPAAGGEPDAAPPPAPATDPTPSATTPPVPLSPEEELLATTSDPAACAVSFSGDGVSDPPILQTQGKLYDALPIPSHEGLVFAGWYATADGAASLSVPARVNGSDAVTCTDRRVSLHAAWMTAERNAAENARIPILMYHQFTPDPQGENGWLRGNYAYIGDFDAHMQYVSTGGFYLPTWDELSAFIDGRLFLPDRSVIVSDDDADQTWFDLAAPVVAKYRVLTTSFMITAYRQDPPPNAYVLRRSHTHDMHRGGADGQGLITSLTVPEIVADMEASFAVLGVKEVVAYPFGQYNDTAKEGLRQAGWELARTTEHGYVTIGADKLALPTIRINYGMGLDAVVGLIG